MYKYSCVAVLTVCDHFYDCKSSYQNAKCRMCVFSRTLQFVYGEMKMANEYKNIIIKILNIYICGGNRLKLYGSQNGNRIEPVRKASILGLEY